MKSAIELAMEKTSGGKKGGPELSSDRKEQIAAIRSKARAMIAQEEIMLDSRLKDMPEGEEKSAVRDGHARSVRKIEERMEQEIEEVKKSR